MICVSAVHLVEILKLILIRLDKETLRNMNSSYKASTLSLSPVNVIQKLIRVISHYQWMPAGLFFSVTL